VCPTFSPAPPVQQDLCNVMQKIENAELERGRGEAKGG